MEELKRNHGIQSYLASIQEMEKQVIESQQDILDQVASQMVETIRRGGRLLVFGTGHSHMMAEEAFYRAGGLAAAVPILVTDLMLHENADLGSRLERTPGLAGILLEEYQVKPGELLFVFSNSGVNQLPVEMAINARQRGLVVVGVCSRAYARIAPLSSLGKRLDEVADFVIDNLGVPGDGLVSIAGSDWRVGPSSTVLGALIWNALITETTYRLQALGDDLPVFVSFNMVKTSGAAEHNRLLLKKWGRVNPHLKGWIQND
jgi:uncharacterized phosphosugar-binding protein